tara:strand:- start:3429 stop:3821 length:393 start_codon:yes stop_codon:yes gene_type:complete
MNLHLLILWISVLTFITYIKYKSQYIIILFALIITVIYYLPSKQQSNIVFDNDIQQWINQLENTKDDTEKDRCYNIIRNIVYSQSLSNNFKNHKQILDIIHKYRPDLPLPSNMDNNTQYDIALGFTENHI